jgi:hypothetical protein
LRHTRKIPFFRWLNSKIQIWNTSKKEQVAELRQTGDINTIVIIADGALLAPDNLERTIALWNLIDCPFTQYKGKLKHLSQPRALPFNLDSHWLARGGSAIFAYLWDLKFEQEMARIPHGDTPVTSLSFFERWNPPSYGFTKSCRNFGYFCSS